MKCEILIPIEKNTYRCFSLKLRTGEPYVMDVPGVCYFRVYKYHDHRYELAYFIYNPRRLGFCDYYTKKDLFSAIQNLLKEFL